MVLCATSTNASPNVSDKNQNTRFSNWLILYSVCIHSLSSCAVSTIGYCTKSFCSAAISSGELFTGFTMNASGSGFSSSMDTMSCSPIAFCISAKPSALLTNRTSSTRCSADKMRFTLSTSCCVAAKSIYSVICGTSLKYSVSGSVMAIDSMARISSVATGWRNRYTSARFALSQ